MNRRALALLAATGALAVAAPAGAGGAATQKGCDSINLGGPKVFYKHQMKCKSAKRKARKVYASRGANEPRRFNCSSGSGFADGANCEHVSKDKYFGWHPAD